MHRLYRALMHYRCGHLLFLEERNAYVNDGGHVNDEVKNNKIINGQRPCQGKVGKYCPKEHVRLIPWRLIIPRQLSLNPRNKAAPRAPAGRMMTCLESSCSDDVRENTFSCDSFVMEIGGHFARAYRLPFDSTLSLCLYVYLHHLVTLRQ